MEQATAYLISVLIAVLFTIFNILTLSIIFLNRKFLHRVSNFPIISFLIGSGLQGLIPAPIYMYRQLESTDPKVQYWTCNVYRFPYFYFGHVMKISLMLVSFDRLLAVKYPFKYERRSVPHCMIFLLIFTWVVTIVVDCVPFMHGPNYNMECKYSPQPIWGIVVILVYDLSPFLLIIINYTQIWLLAARISIGDKRRKESLESQEFLSCSKNETNDPNSHDPLLHKSSIPYGSTDKVDKATPKQSVNRTLSNIKHLMEMRATKTSFILVMLYLILYGPLGTFYIWDNFCYGCLTHGKKNKTLGVAVKLLNFSSSVIAPLAYCWWNKEYRKIAKTVLVNCCRSSKLNMKECDHKFYLTNYRATLPKIVETKIE